VIAIKRPPRRRLDFGVRYAVAFGGGVVSFLSPCVQPLVPVYLSLVTGLDVAAVTDTGRGQALRVGRDTAGFVAGFTAVFVALGLTATLTPTAAENPHRRLPRQRTGRDPSTR
jgi:cytochrome c-type biogenesis protein